MERSTRCHQGSVVGSCKGIKLKPVSKHPPGEAPHPGLGPQAPDTGRSSARSHFTPNARSFGAAGPQPCPAASSILTKAQTFRGNISPCPHGCSWQGSRSKGGTSKEERVERQEKPDTPRYEGTWLSSPGVSCTCKRNEIMLLNCCCSAASQLNQYTQLGIINDLLIALKFTYLSGLMF